MSTWDGPEHTPVPPPILNPAGGANQVRGRAYNERLVLSLVRLYG
ncbi:sugar kinase, partial [Rhizobium ruizarguesonis]